MLVVATTQSLQPPAGQYMTHVLSELMLQPFACDGTAIQGSC